MATIQNFTGAPAACHPSLQIAGEVGFKPEIESDQQQRRPAASSPDQRINAEIWQFQDLITTPDLRTPFGVVHRYIDAALAEFRLEIATPVTGFEKLDLRTVAKYYPGRNAFGLRHQIIVNQRYLNKFADLSLGEFVRVLATITICLLQAEFHQRQFDEGEVFGRADYFPVSVIGAACGLGIHADRRGQVQKVCRGAFLFLLAANGFVIELGDETELRFQPLNSKFRRRMMGELAKDCRPRTSLLKYMCPCAVIVRHAGRTLQATCQRCNQDFRLAEEE